MPRNQSEQPCRKVSSVRLAVVLPKRGLGMSARDLTSKLKGGALWTYLQGSVGTIIQFLAGIVLARLLEPADFGVFLAVTAYVAILSAQVNFGLPTALTQAKELKEEQWNSAFWLMQAIAVLCTGLVFIGSNWLEEFYGDPRYGDIMRLMCANFFLMPFMAINEALLRRQLDFKSIGLIQIKASLAGTTLSLTAAFAGLGPYSLVIGGVSSTVFSTLLMSTKAPWRPKFNFNMTPLRPLLHYSWYTHINGSLILTSQRVDNMLIGRLNGLTELGLYNRAFSLARMPVENLCTPLYQLLFSGFSRIQDDIDHSRLLFKKALCLVASAVFPLLVALILLAHAFVYYIYGSKWLPAVVPLQIMAVGSFMLVIGTTLGSLGAAQNLVRQMTPIQVTNLLLTIAAVAVGARWGLVGVAASITIKILIVQTLQIRMIQRSHIDLGWRDIGTAIVPAALPTLAALLTGGGIAAFSRLYMGYALTDIQYILGVGVGVLGSYILTWIWQARRYRDNPLITPIISIATGIHNRLHQLITRN